MCVTGSLGEPGSSVVAECLSPPSRQQATETDRPRQNRNLSGALSLRLEPFNDSIKFCRSLAT